MPAGSRNIYYLCAPNRHLAEASPYYEAMKKKDAEVGRGHNGGGSRRRGPMKHAAWGGGEV